MRALPCRSVAAVAVAAGLVACGGGDVGDGATIDAGGGPGQPDAATPPLPDHCARLAPPAGATVIQVTPAQAAQLGQIVNDAQPGDVIELADGSYDLSGDVVMNLSKPGLWLISASRDASKVVLDGGPGYAAREIVQITASGVTVAHVTIQRAQDHLVHLYPGGDQDIDGITLYGLVLVDAGQHFVKSNANAPNADYATAEFVDGVTVACSSFTLTGAGRAYVPTNPHNSGYPCYTGGIDAHAAAGWIVTQNRFEGIYCDVPSLAEHAVHFWHAGRDQVVERNTIINCARGIGFGLYWGDPLVERPYPDAPHAADRVDSYVGNFDGVIRNNVIVADVAAFDTGINVEQAIGARIIHNTVVLLGAAGGNAIEARWPNSIVEVSNNLATSLASRDGATANLASNLENPALGLFMDAAGYNLHLAPGAAAAIDQGTVVADPGLDIDGDPHTTGPPDLGADER